MLNVLKINTYFRRVTEVILRFRVACIVGCLLFTAGAAAGLPHLRQDTSQESWFLEGDAALAAKERFEEIFGKDDFCAVFLRADNIVTPENLTLIRELGDELKRKVPYADDVLSITDFEFTAGVEGGLEILKLVPENIEDIPRDAASLARIKERVLSKPMFRNRLLSEDGREAWLVLRLKSPGPEAAEHALPVDQRIGGAVLEIAGQEKYRPLHPQCTGLPVIDVDKRIYFAEVTPRLIGMSLLVITITLWIGLRSARGIFFPLATTICALLLVLGVQGHLRVSMDPVTMFLPIFLTLAMATCYSIHILDFFRREFNRTGKRRNSVLFAAEEAGWSLMFSSLTTMAGMLSFLTIPLRPIRWVGVTSALLVGVTWLLVYVLLPVFLSFGKDRAPLPEEKRGGWAENFLDRFGSRVLNRPKLTLTVFALLFALCMAGLARLEVSFDMRRTVGAGVSYVARMINIGESAVGSLYSYGVAVEFPEPDQAKNPDNLKKFKMLGEEILAFPLTKRISSLVDIIEDMNQVLNDGDAAYNRLPATREETAQLLLLYENAGGAEAEKWVDYDYQRLRMQIEVDDYNSAEIMRELEKIRQKAAGLFPGANIILTGALPQFTVMMDYITWGQIQSFFTALVTIVIIMAAAFGSLRTGLIAMIPNAAPALALSGIMGFMDIPLDIMTVTIVPMLLGLAVDDTIHFINHGGMEFTRTASYPESVRRTFVSVGKAIFLTTVILTLAFSPYLTADDKVFIHMGFLIGIGAIAAMLADFFVTPVLLRLTRAFGPEKG
ncbi:MAG: MMPL family transporter [Desulfovibrio sp.]|jgi:predicted RND superfamily exporter protein|nr:MMPL family transporter [Desulfovibrio sp.]